MIVDLINLIYHILLMLRIDESIKIYHNSFATH